MDSARLRRWHIPPTVVHMVARLLILDVALHALAAHKIHFSMHALPVMPAGLTGTPSSILISGQQSPAAAMTFSCAIPSTWSRTCLWTSAHQAPQGTATHMAGGSKAISCVLLGPVTPCTWQLAACRHTEMLASGTCCHECQDLASAVQIRAPGGGVQQLLHTASAQRQCVGILHRRSCHQCDAWTVNLCIAAAVTVTPVTPHLQHASALTAYGCLNCCVYGSRVCVSDVYALRAVVCEQVQEC
jgi:hypothetical protein